MAHRPTYATLVTLLALSGCATNEAIQALRGDIARIERQVTTLAQRLDRLSADTTQAQQATATLTEKIVHAQQGHADLSARLEHATAQSRAIKGQTDTTQQQLERVQGQVKEAGDRLSRVEFTSAQAAMLAQQAASTAQLTAQSAQSALQSMAEQINTALAGLPGAHLKGIGDHAGPPPGQTPQRTEPSSPRPAQGSAIEAPTTLATAPPAPERPAQGPPPDGRPTSSTGALRTITPRSAPSGPPLAAGEEASLPTDAETAYRLALTAFTHQRYREAIAGFQGLADRYPESPLTAVGLYWLGEAHYAQQAYPQAADAFRRFLAAQPSGPRAPSVLLKLGLIAHANGDVAEAKERFSALTRHYAASQEATVARSLLPGLP